jgi:exodeoxyribonuclease VII large subunit
VVALQTSAEKPAPVRVISQAIGGWIGRLGAVWVEGQVTQLTRRSGTQTAFLTLRDPAADLSLQVTCPHQVLEQVQPPIVEGARVVVHARPAWYYARGTLSLAADEIRPIGLGELLARIERLRGVLAAEGLFAPERKRQLPFLPRVVGLVCGRGSAAEHDVLQNARRRWPAIRFRVLEVAVQGPSAALQVVDAVRTLDRDAEVDVIVLARGGGSVEDLLPFSDETLVRAVASARTPVVSAIGHEGDAPLVDLVADVRASTPTDAAKRIVPDVDEEIERVRRAHERLCAALRYRLDRDQAALAAMRSRPVLADPIAGLQLRIGQIADLRARSRRCLRHSLDRAAMEVEHTRARVRTLSPAATLDRGYAVVQHLDGAVVRKPAEVAAGDRLRIRVAGGEISVIVSDNGTGEPVN